MTSQQYSKDLLKKSGTVVAIWFETWQTWAAAGGALLFLAAIYASSTVNQGTAAAWGFVKALLTPFNVTVAIVVGFVMAVVEAGRQLHEGLEQGIGGVGQEQAELRKQVEDLTQEKRRLSEDVVEAKATARRVEAELDALRSWKEDIRKLAEYEITGREIRKGLGPDVRTPAVEAAFQKWKTEIEVYLRKEHPEHYSYFSAEVGAFGLDDEESPWRHSTVAGKLLERLTDILERLQGRERTVAHGLGQPLQLPPTPIPPNTPTMG